MISFQLTKLLGAPSSGNTGLSTGVSAAVRNSSADIAALDKLVSALLERQKQSNRNEPSKLNRLKSSSFSHRRSASRSSQQPSTAQPPRAADDMLGMQSMPTILESNISTGANAANVNRRNTINRHSSVRRIINSIKNAPHRFSHGMTASAGNNRLVDESSNLTQNVLD